MNTDCPQFEALAAYKDNSLSAEERAELETHFVSCAICRKTVVLAIQTQMVVPDPDIDGPPDEPERDD